jgi:cation transport ATPase
MKTLSLSLIGRGHRATARTDRDPVLDCYNLLLALLLFISPWLIAYVNPAARIDFWATGAGIAVVSVAAIFAFANWEEWLNLMLGVWLMAAPWALGFEHTRAMYVSIGSGAVVAYLAALELWLDRFRY